MYYIEVAKLPLSTVEEDHAFLATNPPEHAVINFDLTSPCGSLIVLLVLALFISAGSVVFPVFLPE